MQPDITIQVNKIWSALSPSMEFNQLLYEHPEILECNAVCVGFDHAHKLYKDIGGNTPGEYVKNILRAAEAMENLISVARIYLASLEVSEGDISPEPI